MKTTMLIVCLALAGCQTWTPQQRTTAKVVAFTLIAGSIAASQHGKSSESLKTTQPVNCAGVACQ